MRTDAEQIEAAEGPGESSSRYLATLDQPPEGRQRSS